MLKKGIVRVVNLRRGLKMIKEGTIVHSIHQIIEQGPISSYDIIIQVPYRQEQVYQAINYLKKRGLIDKQEDGRYRTIALSRANTLIRCIKVLKKSLPMPTYYDDEGYHLFYQNLSILGREAETFEGTDDEIYYKILANYVEMLKITGGLYV